MADRSMPADTPASTSGDAVPSPFPRPMRRGDHRMPEAESLALLARAEVLRLGIVDDEGPYVVPVNFGYVDGCLYTHGPLEGRRIDAARRGARICFEVDEGEIVRAERPCGFTSRFRSVIGYGTMRLLEDRDERLRGLGVIMRQYGSTIDGIREESFARASVAEIRIESMEGGWHLPAPTVGGE